MLNSILILGVIGGILGFGLVKASVIFYVKEDNRVTDVTNLLPGYNCGACGKPGCSGFAEAIISKEVNKISLCKPAKDDVVENILNYLKKADGDFNNTKK